MYSPTSIDSDWLGSLYFPDVMWADLDWLAAELDCKTDRIYFAAGSIEELINQGKRPAPQRGDWPEMRQLILAELQKLGTDPHDLGVLGGRAKSSKVRSC